MTPRFKLGTTFTPQGRKGAGIHTVIDILTTRNSKGEVIKLRYVTTHEFCGQTLTDNDVLETTIARGLIAEGTVEPGIGLPEDVVKSLQFYGNNANWAEVETGIGCYPGDAIDYGAAARKAMASLGLHHQRTKHADCPACTTLIEKAEALMIATGSVEGTARDGEHAAVVARLEA